MKQIAPFSIAPYKDTGLKMNDGLLLADLDGALAIKINEMEWN